MAFTKREVIHRKSWKTGQKWSWPHSRGWTGITIDDCWKGWAIPPAEAEKLIMLPSETMIWQPEFTDKTLSVKTRAVHIGEYYVPWQEFVNSVGKPFRQYAQNMGADTLPDRYRSDGRCRSARTAVHHARRRDRYRRTRNFSFRDRLHEALFSAVLLSASARPSSQKLHNATQCFLIYRNASLRRHFSITCVLSPASAYTRKSVAVYLHLPDRRVQTPATRVFRAQWRTVRRLVSVLLPPSRFWY